MVWHHVCCPPIVIGPRPAEVVLTALDDETKAAAAIEDPLERALAFHIVLAATQDLVEYAAAQRPTSLLAARRTCTADALARDLKGQSKSDHQLLRRLSGIRASSPRWTPLNR